MPVPRIPEVDSRGGREDVLAVEPDHDRGTRVELVGRRPGDSTRSRRIDAPAHFLQNPTMKNVRSVKLAVLGALASLALVTACKSSGSNGGGGGGGKVAVTVRFKNGAGGPSTFAPFAPAAASSLVDGQWFFSPDQAVVRFQSLTLSNGTDLTTADLGSACAVTFNRAQGSGSTALDCPILINNGTYSKMTICFSATVDLLIDDPAVGLFTDPASATMLSTTAPVGGAALVPYVVPGSDPCFQIALPQPVVVTDSSADISIIGDMNKTGLLQVTGGVPSFSTASFRPVAIAAVPGSSGFAEFYDDAAVFQPNVHPVAAGSGGNFLHVFYQSPTAPVVASVNGLCPFTNRPDSAYAYGRQAAAALDFSSGAYLGLDAAAKLAWAIPSDDTWASVQTYVMDRVATLGSSSTLVCSDGTEIVPSSGDTYASGAPTLPSTTQTTTLYLHAR